MQLRLNIQGKLLNCGGLKTWGDRNKLWWESRREMKGRTPAWETAAGKALEMSH